MDPLVQIGMEVYFYVLNIAGGQSAKSEAPSHSDLSSSTRNSNRLGRQECRCEKGRPWEDLIKKNAL